MPVPGSNAGHHSQTCVTGKGGIAKTAVFLIRGSGVMDAAGGRQAVAATRRLSSASSTVVSTVPATSATT